MAQANFKVVVNQVSWDDVEIRDVIEQRVELEAQTWHFGVHEWHVSDDLEIYEHAPDLLATESTIGLSKRPKDLH